MKPSLSSAGLATLKQSTDLVAVVESRGVKLSKQGNDFVGLCPFHKEETPSFRVTPSKNLFHCFGCGAAGSVIDFVMKLDGLPFRKAVDVLLTQTGVVQRAEVSAVDVPAVAPSALSNERARQLLERVVVIYEKTFADVPEGRAYLEKRAMSDGGLWKRHRVGYCNGRLPEILPNQGEVWKELKSLGVLLADGRERFTGCVVFPVFDVDGNLVTLYGRHTGEQMERRHFYLPERSKGLWNAVTMKTHSSVILVESVLDALSVEMAGYGNVVSIQGAGGLTDADVSDLKQYGVQKLILALDGDMAGRAAVKRLKEKLSAFSVEVRNLEDGFDPNRMLVEMGAEKLASFLAGSASNDVPSVQGETVERLSDGLAVRLGVRRYEIRGLEKTVRRLKATVRVEHAGRLHVDTLDFYVARSRRQLVQDLARIFEEAVEVIEADVLKLLNLCESWRGEAVVESGAPVAACTPEEEALGREFGRSADLVEKILVDYERVGLVGERANKLLCYLAMVSRKMERPLSVLTLSSSGAGKTALQDACLSFCPSEDLIKLTSLSGKALFYKERLSLKHKVLALEEGDGVTEADYAIRNLISAGELVIEATIKDLQTGRLTTMANRVEGPTSVFVTTTNPDTNAETKSRVFVISVDESREQTRSILEFQRRRQTLAGLAAETELDPIFRRQHAFQRLLKPLAVVNPYSDQLTFGDDRLQGRRDQPKYLNLVAAVAFLRQMQKTVKRFGAQGAVVEYVEVEREDLALANELADQILGHSLDELSRPGYDLLLLLEKMSGEKKNLFTRREIREYTGWSHARVHRYLVELLEFEYIVAESARNGELHRYRLLYDGKGKDGRRFLLGLKAVTDLKEPCSS